MKTVTCAWCRITHRSNVDTLTNDKIVPYTEGQLHHLQAKTRITYTESEQETEGVLSVVEEVTIEIKYENVPSLLFTAFKYYVLEIPLCDKTIIVGSKEYPAIKSRTGDEQIQTFTFRTAKPL